MFKKPLFYAIAALVAVTAVIVYLVHRDHMGSGGGSVAVLPAGKASAPSISVATELLAGASA